VVSRALDDGDGAAHMTITTEQAELLAARIANNLARV